MQALLEQVKAIAMEAGEHLKRFYARSVEVMLKADHTPVTEADLFINQFLTQKLKQLTPEIPVLSEESCKISLAERQGWQRYWIIDPLDGTQQFIDRTDQFAIMLALVEKQMEKQADEQAVKNVPILGVIHAPILGKTYLATQGGGAFLLDNCELNALQPLAENRRKIADFHRLHIALGSSRREKVKEAVSSEYELSFLQYGSSSLKAGLVAEGKADCYVRLGDTGEWDTAAAEVLLGEIGGKIFATDFQPLSYNQRESLINPHFVMVANGELDWHKIFSFKKSV